MRTRASLVLLLLVGLVAPAAHASPSDRTCRLVRDAVDDVQQDITTKVRQGPPSRALDIINGDIAADVRALTIIIRLAGPVKADAYSPTGFAYSFRFTIDAGDRPQRFELNADIGPASQTYSLLRYDETAGFSGVGMYVHGSLDSSRQAIRITADMSQIQAMAQGALQHPDGHRLHDFEIVSGTSTGEQSVAYVNITGDDVAYGARPTKIGTASCIKPG